MFGHNKGQKQRSGIGMIQVADLATNTKPGTF
jgi:hypothetical protein